MNMEQLRTPQDILLYTLRGNNLNLIVFVLIGSSSYDTNASATERGELLWDRERERIKKKEKEKEIAAKMAVSF